MVSARVTPARYPAHLARSRQLVDGRAVCVRPVRPDDSALEDFQRSTHMDYDRHMAFVCEYEGRIIGEARYVANPDARSCELGIVVADDWRHTGVARLLMEALIRFANAHGFETLEGTVLAENGEMLGFVREFGFQASAAVAEPGAVRIVKRL